jgi:aryl-alcohol dehydrogenase-like predicted oxidoreductase
MLSRRRFVQCLVLAAGGTALPSLRGWAATPASGMRARAIPATGEELPVIGLGTSGSFQVRPGSEEYQALPEVLARFFEGGGRMIDTAPTYGNAEDVLGALLTDDQRRSVFLATKLSGVQGHEAGRRQFADTLRRLKMDSVALLQVHNLRDTETQLEVARELKEAGKVRYVGVTHYVDGAHDELADIVRRHKPDFLQINYSVASQAAEERVLPAARDLGIAVITNRNFDDGRLFQQVAGKSVPDWAAEVGANSWAQLFLKFALSHPAVTTVIPATGKLRHMNDNLQAGSGPLLDERQKAALVAVVRG